MKYPASYLNPDSAGKKYPVMIFFHGAGEAACVQNGGIYNNEKQLIYGADHFRKQVDEGNFDGFLLYPQIYTTNAGCFASSWSGDHYFPLIISFIDSLAKYVRADIDRVVVDGLSSGGVAAWKISEAYPQRIAALAPTSAVGGSGTNYTKFLHLPVWLATGSVDNNPSLSTAQAAVNAFRNIGGNIKHTVYQDYGHFVWDFHWREPGFIDFMRNAHKANPLAFFNKTAFCQDSAVNARLGVTAGFFAYEWKKGDSIIAHSQNGVYNIIDSGSVISFSGNEISVKQFGTYSARFKRSASSAWSEWSPKPVVIQTKVITQTPTIQVAGFQSTAVPAPDGSQFVTLQLPEGFTNYVWLRVSDSAIVSNSPSYQAGPGAYRAKYSEVFGCGSNYSPVFYVQDALDTLPVSEARFNATAGAVRSVKLKWKYAADSAAVRWIEVYAATKADGPFRLLAQVNPADSQYIDHRADPDALNFYRVRLLGDSGTFLSNVLVAKTPRDQSPPVVPANLQFAGANTNSVNLRWNSSSDESGIKYYSVYVNGIKQYATPDTTFTVPYLDSLQTYQFSVAATDSVGNSSDPSWHITATPYKSGLHYRYYHGNWDVLPDFNSLPPVKMGISEGLTVSASIRQQNDYFGFVWEGYLYVPANGLYTFELVSDDGSKMFIDTGYDASLTPFIDNNGLHAAQSRTASRQLSKGFHKVAFCFFEKTGDELMQLYWSKQGGFNRELVPSALFSPTARILPASPAPPDSIPPSVPDRLRYMGSTPHSISFDWQASADDQSEVTYLIYVDDQVIDSTSNTYFNVSGLDSAVLYRVSVVAKDAAGNLSLPATIISAYTHASGLHYRYYEGMWSVLPAFDTIIPLGSGITDSVDINHPVRTAEDDFAFLWQGYIFIPESGTYEFETVSDDGSKFYIGTPYSDSAVAMVDNDGLHGTAAKSAAVYLTKGYHPVAVSFFERGGDAVMRLNWIRPGSSKAPIPSGFFSTQPFSFEPEPVNPDSLRLYELPGPSVLLEWMDASSDETAFEIFRSNSDSVSYKLIARAGAGTTSYIDSTVTPNNLYHYRLRSVNQGGASAFIHDSIRLAPTAIELLSPENVSALALPSLRTAIGWDYPAAGAAAFLIWRLDPGDTLSYQWRATVDSTTTAYLDTVPGNGKYSYFVQATDGHGLFKVGDTVTVYHGNLAPLFSSITSTLYLKTDSMVSVQFTVSDADTDSITVGLINKPRFADLIRVSANTYRISFHPSTNDQGWYTLTVRATDEKGAVSEKQMSVSVNDKFTRSIYVRFGHSSIPAPRPWNNFSGTITANSTRLNLRDEKYIQTPVFLTMVDSWASLTGLCFQTGENSGVYPDTVLARGIRDQSATRRLLIGGLNRTRQYNIVFIASVNEGVYAANSYAAGNQKDTLVIRYNSNETGNLNNLIPDSLGQIYVNINRLPGTPFIYLTGIVIEEYSSAITMLPPANLHAAIETERSVRVSWADRTQYENQADGYQLQRATDSTFSSGLWVIGLPKNSSHFTDTTIQSGQQYWYRVRAMGAGGTYTSFSNQRSVKVPAKAIYVNFNHNVPAAPAPWNNSAAGPNYRVQFPPLLNSAGENSGITLRIAQTFNGENNAGMNTGNNTGIVPDNVLRSNYWIDKLQVAQIVVSGLHVNKTYSFGFIGSIGPQGWVANNYTATYSIGGVTVYLNAWQNTTKWVYIHQVKADEEGKVVIRFSTTKDAVYGFNAGMVIHEFDDTLVTPSAMYVEATPARFMQVNPAPSELKTAVRVFPNPSDGNFQVEYHHHKPEQPVFIKIFSESGILIKQYRYQASNGINRWMMNKDVFTLPGVYLVQLSDGITSIASEKVIILR